jgi:hypothetical protein
MQSQESQSRATAALNHPKAEEWMAYLYDEIAPERKDELFQHLAHCAECGRQLNEWRTGMKALDSWKLAPAQHHKVNLRQSAPVLKWAAAAVLVLCVGFAAGRVSSGQKQEVAELKATVAQLVERTTETSLSEPAREELIRLLASYSKLNEERRTEDGRVTAAALRELELRLGKLRSELETVALNTESGFRQTKEGLATLATYALSDSGSEPKAFDSKN